MLNALPKTFDAGLQFLEENVQRDGWFLQIETFDPHEPFDVPDSFNRNWFDPDAQSIPDWPDSAIRPAGAFRGWFPAGGPRQR